MAFIIDAALDAGLNYVRSNTTVLHITSAAPSSFANVATVTLGNKATPTLGAIGDATGGGRKFTVSAVTDGSVTATGTASHWALVSGTELLAWNELASTQAVTSGNTLTLTAFDVRIADAVDA